MCFSGYRQENYKRLQLEWSLFTYWKAATSVFQNWKKYINETFTNRKFPGTLKLSNETPVYRKLEPSYEASYKPACSSACK